MKRISVGVIAVIALCVGAAAGYAASPFGDVGDDHTFSDDIAWLEAAGVTLGCRDAPRMEFCPNDDVTHGQMAAFLRRLAESGAVDAGTLGGMTLDEVVSRVSPPGPPGPAGPAGPTGAIGPVGGIDVWDTATDTRVGALLGYDHVSEQLSYMTDAGDIETGVRTPAVVNPGQVDYSGGGCTGDAYVDPSVGDPGTYIEHRGTWWVITGGQAMASTTTRWPTAFNTCSAGVVVTEIKRLIEPAPGPPPINYEFVPRS